MLLSKDIFEMKKSITYTFLLGLGLIFTSCIDLDLNPLSQASSGGWNDSPEEIKMSVNDLFRAELWPVVNECWTDNEVNRNNGNNYIRGVLTSQETDVKNMWQQCYRAIGRDHTVMQKLLEMGNPGILTQAEYNQYLGECYFVRACMYSRLVFHYGDVPYCDHIIDIDTAFQMGRTPKDEVLVHIYDDFQQAVNLLPLKSAAEQRVTKCAALGMWARTALWFSDWDKVIECTSEIMRLNEENSLYELHPNFGELFLSSTHNTSESLFSLARSVELGLPWDNRWQDFCPRNNNGYAALSPSWELLAGFLCDDGQPIDETATRFDRTDPTKYRDPRCAATIVKFGSTVLGYEYDPNVVTGKTVIGPDGTEVTNRDNKANTDVASYNALIWRKYLDETCYQNNWKTGHDLIILRYADILLMYAEAKIENDEIDGSVLEAMNQVRERAYNGYTPESDTEHPAPVYTNGKYPEITTTDKAELLTLIRYERRMEFARENSRYYDLIRWRLMETALKGNSYGISNNWRNIEKNMNDEGMWLWAFVPTMDENGLPDFSYYETINPQAPDSYAGYAMVLQTKNFQNNQYLWPIPENEVLINDNIQQNPGY